MKIEKKIMIKYLGIAIVSILLLILCFYFVTKYENDRIDNNKAQEQETTATNSKSKNDSDAEAAKENTMLDFDIDRIWFYDPDNILIKLPISANALKSEMVTKYLRDNGYSDTESITVLDSAVSVNGSNYTFSCQIDGTEDIIVITWDSYEGLFSYYIKLGGEVHAGTRAEQ